MTTPSPPDLSSWMDGMLSTSSDLSSYIGLITFCFHIAIVQTTTSHPSHWLNEDTPSPSTHQMNENTPSLPPQWMNEDTPSPPPQWMNEDTPSSPPQWMNEDTPSPPSNIQKKFHYLS